MILKGVTRLRLRGFVAWLILVGMFVAYLVWWQDPDYRRMGPFRYLPDPPPVIWVLIMAVISWPVVGAVDEYLSQWD